MDRQSPHVFVRSYSLPFKSLSHSSFRNAPKKTKSCSSKCTSAASDERFSHFPHKLTTLSENLAGLRLAWHVLVACSCIPIQTEELILFFIRPKIWNKAHQPLIQNSNIFSFVICCFRAAGVQSQMSFVMVAPVPPVYLWERKLRWIISVLHFLLHEHPCHPFIMVSSTAKANICRLPLRVEERNWNVTFFIATASSFDRLTLPAEDWLLGRLSLKVSFHCRKGTQDYFSKWCVDAFGFGKRKVGQEPDWFLYFSSSLMCKTPQSRSQF